MLSGKTEHVFKEKLPHFPPTAFETFSSWAGPAIDSIQPDAEPDWPPKMIVMCGALSLAWCVQILWTCVLIRLFYCSWLSWNLIEFIKHVWFVGFHVGLPLMAVANEKEQTVKCQWLDVVYFYSILLFQRLYRLLGRDFYPFSHSLPIFIIVKHSASPNSQLTMLIVLHICFSREVNRKYSHGIMRDPVSVESPQWKSYYKRQVYGLVFWMNPQVCACFRRIILLESVEIVR